MSQDGDTFWVSLIERVFGILLIVIGAIVLYFTATTEGIGGFGLFFGVLSIILVIIGIFLLVVKPPQ